MKRKGSLRLCDIIIVDKGGDKFNTSIGNLLDSDAISARQYLIICYFSARFKIARY